MATNIKPSKLTDLTAQRRGSEFQRYSSEALRWFTSKINNLRNPALLARQIKQETGRNTNRFVIGGLYYYYYNAKTAERLDYWDAFPLVIPLERYSDGFLGLNLHYIPPRIRAGFMDKLMSKAVVNENDDPIKLRISYDILNATRRYKEFRPCLKRYLYSNIGSKILKVQPEEWETAVMLPTQQFQKATAKEVWKDSVMEIKGHTQHANTATTIGQV